MKWYEYESLRIMTKTWDISMVPTRWFCSLCTLWISQQWFRQRWCHVQVLQFQSLIWVATKQSVWTFRNFGRYSRIFTSVRKKLYKQLCTQKIDKRWVWADLHQLEAAQSNDISISSVIWQVLLVSDSLRDSACVEGAHRHKFKHQMCCPGWFNEMRLWHLEAERVKYQWHAEIIFITPRKSSAFVILSMGHLSSPSLLQWFRQRWCHVQVLQCQSLIWVATKQSVWTFRNFGRYSRIFTSVRKKIYKQLCTQKNDRRWVWADLHRLEAAQSNDISISSAIWQVLLVSDSLRDSACVKGAHRHKFKHQMCCPGWFNEMRLWHLEAERVKYQWHAEIIFITPHKSSAFVILSRGHLSSPSLLQWFRQRWCHMQVLQFQSLIWVATKQSVWTFRNFGRYSRIFTSVRKKIYKQLCTQKDDRRWVWADLHQLEAAQSNDISISSVIWQVLLVSDSLRDSACVKGAHRHKFKHQMCCPGWFNEMRLWHLEAERVKYQWHAEIIFIPPHKSSAFVVLSMGHLSSSSLLQWFRQRWCHMQVLQFQSLIWVATKQSVWTFRNFGRYSRIFTSVRKKLYKQLCTQKNDKRWVWADLHQLEAAQSNDISISSVIWQVLLVSDSLRDSACVEGAHRHKFKHQMCCYQRRSSTLDAWNQRRSIHPLR